MKGINWSLTIFFAGIFSCRPQLTKDQVKAPYEVQNINLPDGLVGETGALAFLPDGRLVACFLRGEVMIFDPIESSWEVFAKGLHEPLGILVLSDKEMLIMQRPELTRLLDTDGDGRADVFETVTDEFGMTGNYHEWNYGPISDKKGNLYFSLNTASEYGHIMKDVRGTLDTTVVPGKPMQKYAAVPYRGWVMQISPSKAVVPFASGFRSPNGLVVDDADRLFVIDNQGDWVGTSKLYQVQEGHFYGHPASLIWKDGWNQGDPSKLPTDVLDSMRTEAAVLFPHGIIAASPTQPVFDLTAGKFGPFSDQLFIGEMNQPRILRVMLEEVNGQMQGACMPFLDGHGLLKGNNRLAFAPDGSLWVGHAQHFFIGDLGIQRIVYTGKTPMDILRMNLLEDGFELVFTQPIHDEFKLLAEEFSLRHYYYEYHLKYGSDQYDVQNVPIIKITISDDRRNVQLKVTELKTEYIYELQLPEMISRDGIGLKNKLICYTVNQLVT